MGDDGIGLDVVVGVGGEHGSGFNRKRVELVPFRVVTDYTVIITVGDEDVARDWVEFDVVGFGELDRIRWDCRAFPVG